MISPGHVRALISAVTVVTTVVFSPAFAAAPELELLDPEKAFRISTRALDARTVEVRFEIAEGYYMYRDRFKFQTSAGKVLADVELPKGKVKDDPFFGRTETYRREVRVRVPLTDASIAERRVRLKVTSQGCADAGVCYLPLEQLVDIDITGESSTAPAPRPAASFWNKAPSRILEPGPASVPPGGFR